MRVLTILLFALVGCDRADSGAPPTAPTPTCEDPQRINAAVGIPSGYVRCADGSVDRVAVVPVDPSIYDARITLCQDRSSAWTGQCHTDGDCGDPGEDRCIYVDNEFGSWCECTTLCSRDEDCDQGQACISPAATGSRYAWPTCVTASCTTGADCESGECGVAAMDYQSETYFALACRTPDDRCRTNDDCENSSEPGDLCRPWEDGVWQCTRWHPID